MIRTVGYCVGMLATLSALVVAGGGVAAAASAPVVLDVTPTHGPGTGGTVVTVSGSGFGADSTVSWAGGAPITPGSITAGGTSLTFTTPAHAAGVVDLRVTSGGATSKQTLACDGGSVDCTATDAFWFDDVGGKPAPPVLDVVSDNPTREGSAFFIGRNIPGYSATIYDEPAGTVACSMPASAQPLFKCELDELAVGIHHFQATQSAPGGLTSDLSSTLEVTVLEPIAPPTITSPRNGSTLDGPTVHVSGTGLPGAELHVASNLACPGIPGAVCGELRECAQIVSASGRWSCTVTVTSQPLQRTLVLVADQTAQGESEAVGIEVTLLVPPPKITAPPDGSVIPGPTTVKISGSGLAIGAVTVTVYDHGKQICAATVQRSGGGSWTCTATLGIGTHSLTARQHDTFGNRSRSSQVVSLSVTAPAVPLAATGGPIRGQITLAVALMLAGLIALRAGASRPR